MRWVVKNCEIMSDERSKEGNTVREVSRLAVAALTES